MKRLLMEKMNPLVDFYFVKPKRWQEELGLLRLIVLDCGLHEELKWGVPCYALEKSKIVLIHTFKEYCALLFFKGALMDDPAQILVQQTENTQATRQIRFTNAAEIVELETAIREYIKLAVTIERAGLKVTFKKASELVCPAEFQRKLEEEPGLETAFKALTPGRQKAYNLYFSAPRLARTRESRVEKYIPRILSGKGLADE